MLRFASDGNLVGLHGAGRQTTFPARGRCCVQETCFRANCSTEPWLHNRASVSMRDSPPCASRPSAFHAHPPQRKPSSRLALSERGRLERSCAPGGNEAPNGGCLNLNLLASGKPSNIRENQKNARYFRESHGRPANTWRNSRNNIVNLGESKVNSYFSGASGKIRGLFGSGTEKGGKTEINSRTAVVNTGNIGQTWEKGQHPIVSTT